MIEIIADKITREAMVLRIMAVFRSATKEEERQGRTWYATARQIADMAADGDVTTGAAVIAALSPMTEWSANVELACDAIEAGSMERGHLKDACSKVNRLLAGVPPEDVLPMSAKTGQFYRCIVDPADPEPVCIDRHAHDIAVGERYGNRPRGLSAKGRYALIAHCYREAAYRLGEIPSTVQAVTWIVWTNEEV